MTPPSASFWLWLLATVAVVLIVLLVVGVIR